jgi:hypothetical protein
MRPTGGCAAKENEMTRRKHERFIESAPECAVCCGLHDDDVHRATESVHVWFRGELDRRTNRDFAIDLGASPSF